MGYSPRGHEESDMTESLNLYSLTLYIYIYVYIQLSFLLTVLYFDLLLVF